MARPILFLTVGLPGTGKTTGARRIEVEQHALRLTKDEWMKALYGLENPSSASDVIEGRLVDIALRAAGRRCRPRSRWSAATRPSSKW
jgi:predicted kinase